RDRGAWPAYDALRARVRGIACGASRAPRPLIVALALGIAALDPPSVLVAEHDRLCQFGLVRAAFAGQHLRLCVLVVVMTVGHRSTPFVCVRACYRTGERRPFL